MKNKKKSIKNYKFIVDLHNINSENGFILSIHVKSMLITFFFVNDDRERFHVGNVIKYCFYVLLLSLIRLIIKSSLFIAVR